MGLGSHDQLMNLQAFSPRKIVVDRCKVELDRLRPAAEPRSRPDWRNSTAGRAFRTTRSGAGAQPEQLL